MTEPRPPSSPRKAESTRPELPVLTTSRLVLRPFRSSDAEAAFDLWRDPEVHRYNATEPVTSIELAATHIGWWKKEVALGHQLMWAVALSESDRVIGDVSMYGLDKHHRKASIGYMFAASSWGNGYATEAIRAVLEHGFGAMGLHRIEAYSVVENERSVRLLERLGFQREGIQRQGRFENDGEFHDLFAYGLLKSEFFT